MRCATDAAGAIVDLGSPLGNAVQLDALGGTTPGSPNVGGFSILQAESMAALLTTLSGHPHFMAPGTSIEVHEFLPMPGM